MGSELAACKICAGSTLEVGSKNGRFKKQLFDLRHCPVCRYSFVTNPWTEYEGIYSDAYYQGAGADPLIDYNFDLQEPTQTAHFYEWRGVLSAVQSLTLTGESSTWLDFGCGMGGLVQYALTQGLGAQGFDQGTAAMRARAAGIPIIDSRQLELGEGTYDIVTAIEVLEHVEEPLRVLEQIRRLLRPGGLFFYTTGNAEPYRNRLLDWAYVVPEIHISFYEPTTMEIALRRTGFRPELPGYLPGFTDVLRYKVLKNLGVKRRSVWESALPWPVLSRAAQMYFKTLAHPVGWAV